MLLMPLSYSMQLLPIPHSNHLQMAFQNTSLTCLNMSLARITAEMTTAYFNHFLNSY